jgi:hypothetical protein
VVNPERTLRRLREAKITSVSDVQPEKASNQTISVQEGMAISNIKPAIGQGQRPLFKISSWRVERPRESFAVMIWTLEGISTGEASRNIIQ